MNDFAIGICFICAALCLQAWHFINDWNDSIERVRTDHSKFKAYMERLDEKEAGEEMLMKFNNTDELKSAVKRLKRCVK